MKLINKRGTTLVEIIVVVCIIAILSLVVWRLFYIGHATFDEGIWRNEREQEVKVGFRTLQEDIKNLSNLSATFGSKYVFNKTKAFNFNYNGKALSKSGIQKGEKVFEFYLCRQPLKVGLGNDSLNKSAIIEKAEYFINDKRELMYKKFRGEIAADDYKSAKSIDTIEKLNPSSINMKQVSSRLLMRDVESIKLKPYGKETVLKRKRPVIVRVEMVHITRHRKSLKPLTKEVLLDMNVEPSKL